MKIFLLFYMCHFAMGLIHCYKQQFFFTFITISQQKSSDFDEILYIAADFELDERQVALVRIKKLHWTD